MVLSLFCVRGSLFLECVFSTRKKPSRKPKNHKTFKEKKRLKKAKTFEERQPSEEKQSLKSFFFPDFFWIFYQFDVLIDFMSLRCFFGVVEGKIDFRRFFF